MLYPIQSLQNSTITEFNYEISTWAWQCGIAPIWHANSREKTTFHDIRETFHLLSAKFPFLSMVFPFLSAEFPFYKRRILGGPFRAPLQFLRPKFECRIWILEQKLHFLSTKFCVVYLEQLLSAKFAFLSADFLFLSVEFTFCEQGFCILSA